MVEKDYKLYGTKILKLKNAGNLVIDLLVGEQIC